MRQVPSIWGLTVAVLICFFAIVGCDRSPSLQEIEGVWKVSEEARDLLRLSAESALGTVNFMPGGRLQVEMIPPIFVGSLRKSLVTAEGTWEVARDSSSSVRTTLQMDGGQVQSVLEIVKKDGRTYLAVWLDEPGGQPLTLQRSHSPSNGTR